VISDEKPVRLKLSAPPSGASRSQPGNRIAPASARLFLEFAVLSGGCSAITCLSRPSSASEDIQLEKVKRKLVRAVGIEPTLLAEPDFESGASTSSTTPATYFRIAATVAFAKQRELLLARFDFSSKLRTSGYRFTLGGTLAGPGATNVHGTFAERAKQSDQVYHPNWAHPSAICGSALSAPSVSEGCNSNRSASSRHTPRVPASLTYSEFRALAEALRIPF
jgi:hypothetical protein